MAQVLRLIVTRDMAIVTVACSLVALIVGVLFLLRENKKERGLFATLASEVVRKSTHELVHAGGETGYYFDTDVLLGRPASIAVITDWLIQVVEETRREYGRLDRLGFLEKREGAVGALTLKDLLSLQTGIPAITVRLRSDIPSSILKIKGAQAEGASGCNVLRANERVLLVSDVATSGDTVLDAVRIVRDAGGVVPVAAVLFDREEGAGTRLRSEGIELKTRSRKSEVEKFRGRDAREVQAAA